MKSRYSIILISLFFLSSCSSSIVNNFIGDVKKNDTAIAMSIPGWLIHLGTNLALSEMEDNDERAIMSLGKKVKGIRFVTDQNASIPRSRLLEVIEMMKIEDNYEPYTIVRQKDAYVYVMVREEKEIIKNLTVLVHGDQSITVMDLKTELTFNELKKADFSWNKEKLESE